MRRFTKMILVLISIFTLTFGFTGCNDSNAPSQISIIVPAGAPTLSVVKLMYEKPAIDNKIQLDITSTPATDVIVAEILAGKPDMAIVPVNLALQLYNRGIEYSLVSVNTWGNLYLISDTNISISDFKGKTVNMIGKGLIPDIMFRYILVNNGIDPDKDITINYYKGAEEVLPLFLKNENVITIMPEPALSSVKTKKAQTQVVLDFQKEWQRLNNSELAYPQSGLFVKNELINTSPKIVEGFKKLLAESSEWVNNNPEIAGKYYEELELGLSKEIAAKAVFGSNIKHVEISDIKQELTDYYKILFDFSKDSVGGKLADDNFFK